MITGVLFFFATFSTFVSADEKHDWRIWRGPNRNGIANVKDRVPISWNAATNIRWKAAVPGRGHSSPIVVGDQVILTTADESQHIQSVISFDRTTGKQLWKTDVNQGGFTNRVHAKNTHASPTVASNGKTLFAAFNHHGAVHLVSLDLKGKMLWQKNLGAFQPQAYSFGYAPSPALYKSLVIIAAEVETNGYLAAFDQATGGEVWRTPRLGCITHSSPIVANVSGRDQLLISGCQKVSSYAPSTGRQLWSAAGASKETCGTMVWDGGIVFASGGYPKKETAAVRADGSGTVLWNNTTACFEQSMLAYKGYLYAVDDNGIAYCWEGKTGRRTWRTRLGGKVSSSPILAGENIYLTNEQGTTYVFRAHPEKFELVAKNQLGDEGFATPAICDDVIFLRTANQSSGTRRETLYCIGVFK